MKTTLRLRLPRLAKLQQNSMLGFALVDTQRVLRQGELPLDELAAKVPVARAVAILHPADATVAQVDMPPLAAHRLGAALPAAIEPLALTDAETLAIAHGPRNAAGRVPVAWTDRMALQSAWALLADHGLHAEAIVPAALAIPVTPGGMTVMLHDGAVVVRLDRDEGHALELDPLAAPGDPGEAVLAWLSWLRGSPRVGTVRWVGNIPPWWHRVPAHGDDASKAGASPADEPSASLTARAGFTAELPAWSLALPDLRPARMQRSPWFGSLAWLAGAAAVWTLGLNLHAAQLGAEETRLRQRMIQQVRTAFPELPVVLDPLRQATQQRDLRRHAAGSVAEADFLPLAMAAARLLPGAASNVTSLAYEDGTLTLVFANQTGLPQGALDAAVASRAGELGLQVDQQDGKWTVRRQDARDTSDTGQGVSFRSATAPTLLSHRNGVANR